jgi:hypothetical protein
MGRECGTNGVEDDCKFGCFGGNPKEKEHYEDLDVDERLILKSILGKLEGGY